MRIIIVGKNRSGKTTIAKKFVQKTSWPIVEVSDIVKRISGRTTRAELQTEKQKHTDDPDWLYREINQEILAKKSENIIVSGVREQYLVSRMKQDSFEVKVVGAFITDAERRRRTVELDKKSDEEFDRDDLRDKELFDLDRLLEMSDYQISTEKSFEEMEAEVEQVLKYLGIQN